MFTLTQIINQQNKIQVDLSQLSGMPSMNMELDTIATEPIPKMNYYLQTDPSPLRVSEDSQHLRKASVTILAYNNTNNIVNCKSIIFRFAIGVDFDSLTSNPASIKVTASPGWQITHENGVVTATPLGSSGQISSHKGVSFTIFDISVSEKVGISPLDIEELVIVDQLGEITGRTRLALNKFSAEFYLRNYFSMKPQVKYGETADLSWEGSAGATYTIYWDDKYKELTDVTLPWKSPPLLKPTVFQLVATTQMSGQSVSHYLALVVDVQNPNLEAPGGIKIGQWGDKNRTQVNLNRGLIGFSHAINDWNHSIYNNLNNIDGQGPWDGMKMNVFEGLDIRTGDANTDPKMVASFKKEQITVNGILRATEIQPMIIKEVIKVSGQKIKFVLNKPIESGILRIFGRGKDIDSSNVPIFIRINDKIDSNLYYSYTRFFQKMTGQDTVLDFKEGLTVGYAYGGCEFSFSYNILVQNSKKIGQGYAVQLSASDDIEYMLGYLNFGVCRNPDPITEIVITGVGDLFTLSEKDVQVIYEPFYTQNT